MAKERKELDLVIAFEHMDVDHFNNKWFKIKYKPKKMIKALDKWQTALPWNCLYFENHDQPRSVSRFGSYAYHKESAKMLGLILLSLRGTPFIYQGEEIGMTNGDFMLLDDVMDKESHNIWKVGRKLKIPRNTLTKMILKATRDHARTPMQWDSKGWVNPWLKQNANRYTINVEKSLKDENSILKFYKKLIKFRKNSDCLTKGEYRLVSKKKDVFTFERSYENKRITNCRKYD